MRGTPTGRMNTSGPNMQSIAPKTPEAAAIREAFIGTPEYIYGWPVKPDPEPWLAIVRYDGDGALLCASMDCAEDARWCVPGGTSVTINDNVWTTLASQFCENRAEDGTSNNYTLADFEPGGRLADVLFYLGWEQPITDDLGYLENSLEFQVEAGGECSDLPEFQRAFVAALNALACPEGHVVDSESESESGAQWNDPQFGRVGAVNDNALTFEQKIAVLFAYGFTVGVRDARFNTDYSGFYMVVEGSIAEIERDYSVPFADGANGPYCLVGNNLAELVDEALDLASNFDNFDAIVADIKAGGVGIPHTREGLIP